MGLTPVWELRCHTPPSKATVKRTSDLIQLKTPGLSAQLLCSQRAGLGSALSRWHSWIWVRYMASLLCPGLRAQTPGSGAFQASSGVTGADPLWRKGQVAQQAIRDQRSRPLSGRPHQALPSSCHRHFLVLSHLPDHTLYRDNNLPRPSTAWPPSPSLPLLFPLPSPSSPLSLWVGKPSACPGVVSVEGLPHRAGFPGSSMSMLWALGSSTQPHTAQL